MKETKKVVAYKLPDGRCPIKIWRQGLKDFSARKAVDIRIDRAAAGNTGLSKSIGEGVFELKIDYGPGYRVYFAYDGDTILLLLIGGDKATQEKDIKTAKQYLKHYKDEQNAKN